MKSVTIQAMSVLVSTIYGEAEGESYVGKCAVAEVIVNRANDPAKRWSEDVAEVCLQPHQFECWSKVVRRRAIEKATLGSSVLRDCYAAVLEIGLKPARVPGANHFLTTALWLGGRRPRWSKSMKVVKHIGGHVFLEG